MRKKHVKATREQIPTPPGFPELFPEDPRPPFLPKNRTDWLAHAIDTLAGTPVHVRFVDGTSACGQVAWDLGPGGWPKTTRHGPRVGIEGVGVVNLDDVFAITYCGRPPGQRVDGLRIGELACPCLTPLRGSPTSEPST